MTNILMLLLIVSPVASIIMLSNQRSLYKSIIEINENIKHINEVNSLNNNNIKSLLDSIDSVKSNTMESISTNESK